MEHLILGNQFDSEFDFLGVNNEEFATYIYVMADRKIQNKKIFNLTAEKIIKNKRVIWKLTKNDLPEIKHNIIEFDLKLTDCEFNDYVKNNPKAHFSIIEMTESTIYWTLGFAI